MRGCAGSRVRAAEERAARGSCCHQAELFSEGGSGALCLRVAELQPEALGGRGGAADAWLSGGAGLSPSAAGVGTARLHSARAMPAHRTEDGPNAHGTAETPDSRAAACLPTTSMEVVGEEDWGSFYSSFKVSVPPSTPNTDFKKQDK